MGKLTKVIAGFLAISTMLVSVSSIYVSADEVDANAIIFDNSIDVSVDENLVLNGVSTVPPLGNMPSGDILYGTKYPSSTRDLATEGLYTFSGSANTSTLYTEYNFTGVDNLSISVKNNHSTQLTVTVYMVKITDDGKIGGQYKHSFKVDSNKTGIKTYPVKADEKYFLGFSAPSNFSGFVQ